jgi:hemoglobin
MRKINECVLNHIPGRPQVKPAWVQATARGRHIDLDQGARPAACGTLFIDINKLGRTMHSSATPVRQERQLYESIGGRTGVAALVERFYGNVLNDPELAPFFKNTSIDRLHRMQTEFFAAALGGPVSYGGTAISHAHQGLKITLPDFQRFVKHLFDTLSDFELSDDERYEVVQRISKYVNEVTGAPGGY